MSEPSRLDEKDRAIIDKKETTIYQRLFMVQAAIPYMKKSSETGVGGKGVSRDALVAAVRRTLLEHGILVSTSQVGVGSTITASRKTVEDGKASVYTDTFLYTGTYETSFINVLNPSDRHCVTNAGHGKDQSDKATGKARTYAEKMNIISALFLETGIDDESRDKGDEEPQKTGGGSGAGEKSGIKTPQSKSAQKPDGGGEAHAITDDSLASPGLRKQLLETAKANGKTDALNAYLKEKGVTVEQLSKTNAARLLKKLQPAAE